MGLTLNVIREPDEFCKPCGAYKTCKTPIMNGQGTEHPIWLFVGEAPGAEEDEEGIPFIGDAGEILRDAIDQVGIPVKNCRFTNVVRCRPPKNNIKHYPNCIPQCRPHILREIHTLKPKVIVLLGNSAIQSILNKRGIMNLHNEIIDIGAWKYVCCFHPSYLLRNNNEGNKKKFLMALTTAKNIGMNKSTSLTREKREHIIVKDHKTLQEMRDILLKQKYLATDIEGSTLSPFAVKRKPKIGCVGFSWDSKTACCFPLESRVNVNVKVPEEEFLEVMKEVWESEDIKHIAHFGKYDYVYPAVLHDIWMGGKDKCGYYADTGQMSYVNNERKGVHGLKDWSYKLGMGGYDTLKRQFELANPAMDSSRGGNINYIPMDILGPYNMDDCIATWRLFWLLKKRLIKQRLWHRPFLFPQMWHNWTAAVMEINGLKIDMKRNVELDEIYREQEEKVEQSLRETKAVRKLQKIKDRHLMEKIYLRVKNYKKPVDSVKDKVIEFFESTPLDKRIVNLNAPEARRTLVFDVLGYESVYETKKSGLPSVEREVLETLLKQDRNPVLKKLIEIGELQSAHSKYITPLRDWRGTDGRTHTFYKPQGQLTGRVASEDPNHENLPKHGRLAKDLRSQFVSSGPDYYILEEDSKQIEMRLFADRAKDDIMIQEFNEGKDPHAMGAQAGFEISEKKWLELPDEKRKHLRFLAKSAISFGLLYGRGANALALDFGQTIRWAEKFIARYFGKYDDCLQYQKDREEYILKHGIVYSHFFRRRHCDGWDSEAEAMQARAVREGINSPIQGDASDITWVALHRLAKWMRKYRMKSKAIIAVHDAGYVDAYYKEMEDIVERLRMYMTDRDFIHKMTGWYCEVPLDTDAIIGSNLSNGTELKRSGKEFIVPKEFRTAS